MHVKPLSAVSSSLISTENLWSILVDLERKEGFLATAVKEGSESRDAFGITIKQTWFEKSWFIDSHLLFFNWFIFLVHSFMPSSHLGVEQELLWEGKEEEGMTGGRKEKRDSSL